jgi:hypothetical protein
VEIAASDERKGDPGTERAGAPGIFDSITLTRGATFFSFAC